MKESEIIEKPKAEKFRVYSPKDKEFCLFSSEREAHKFAVNIDACSVQKLIFSIPLNKNIWINGDINYRYMFADN